MSKDKHLKKVMDHLNNTLFCEKLEDDFTERFSEEIMTDLAGMTEREILDGGTFDFLWPRNARTSRFYILPKIYNKDILGRPIVSSCGAPTEKISSFVDYHLRPLVKKIPSYIKDINDFLVKLNCYGTGTFIVYPAYTSCMYVCGKGVF